MIFELQCGGILEITAAVLQKFKFICSCREFQRLDEKVVANKWFLPLVWCAKIIGEGVENGNLNVSPDYSKS